jgi:hypothetical protein
MLMLFALLAGLAMGLELAVLFPRSFGLRRWLSGLELRRMAGSDLDRLLCKSARIHNHQAREDFRRAIFHECARRRLFANARALSPGPAAAGSVVPPHATEPAPQTQTADQQL